MFFKPDLASGKNTQKAVTAKLERATRSFADQLKDINSLRDLEDSARVALDELHNLEARTLQHCLQPSPRPFCILSPHLHAGDGNMNMWCPHRDFAANCSRPKSRSVIPNP